MVVSTNQKRFKKVLILTLLFFLFCGAVPIFSQEILASFKLGIAPSEARFFTGEILPLVDNFFVFIPSVSVEDRIGFAYGVNLLFIGTSGFTISSQINFVTVYVGNQSNIVNSTIYAGIGYVYYNTFYIGGLMNFGWGPSFSPTIVAGYDFGWFFLGGQLSYTVRRDGPSGFGFTIGAGVNVGSSSRNRVRNASRVAEENIEEIIEEETVEEDIWWW